MGKLGTVWNRDAIAQTLRGRQAYPVPCASLYTGLYVDPIYPRVLAAVYAELARGELELALTLDQELDAQVEATVRSWELFDPPFAWLARIPGGPIGAYDGVTVSFGEESCIRRGPDGSEEDLLHRETPPCMHLWERDSLPRADAIDELVPVADSDAMMRAGCHEVMARMVARCDTEVWLISSVGSPYEGLHVLGFVGMMEVLRRDHALAEAIIERTLHNSLQTARMIAASGIRAVFVEQCWASSDLISEADYARFAAPYDQRLVAGLKELGLEVLFHMTGGIEGRLPYMREFGADAIALEDGKKGFVVDLERVRRELGDGITLWGNINPVVIRDGPRERIEAEVRAQFQAAGPPFVTSCGSPLTLDTPVANVNMMLQASAELNG